MPSMSQAPAGGQPEATCEEIILGVDTHKHTHVAAVLSAVGSVLSGAAFPATAVGYQQLLDWARGFGIVGRAGVEATGSYGAALTRYLLGEGVQVLEVNQPDHGMRRRRGKTDQLDAQAAARAVLAGAATATAKTGNGPAEMARMLRLAKTSAVKARTQAINQLKAVLVSTDPGLRASLDGLGPTTLIRRCAELDPVTVDDPTSAAVYTLRVLAGRVVHLSEEISDLHQRLRVVVQAGAPGLLERVGIGPDSAAALLITAGDNPDRLEREGSFAAVCGACPVEASSGMSQRKRLNRGGDRQANAALYRIVFTRLRCDPRSRAYLERRLAQGKTRREVIRCLKRYVAREVYPLLKATPATRHHTPAAA
jgi:transposase